MHDSPRGCQYHEIRRWEGGSHSNHILAVTVKPRRMRYPSSSSRNTWWGMTVRSGEYDRTLEPRKFHQDATVTGAKRSPSFMIVQTYGRGSLSIDIGSLCFPTMSSISARARCCIYQDVYVAMSSKNDISAETCLKSCQHVDIKVMVMLTISSPSPPVYITMLHDVFLLGIHLMCSCW